jgi:hypothetical protein
VRLPGPLGDRLRVLRADRARFHAASDTAVLARRWAEARRTWELPHIRMDTLGREVEHRRITAGEEGAAVVVCRRRDVPGDTVWVFEGGAPAQHRHR